MSYNSLSVILGIFIHSTVSIFMTNFIPYREKNKWGFCDSSFIPHTDYKFDYVEPFRGRFAKVRIGNDYLFLEKNGDLLVHHHRKDTQLSSDNNYSFLDRAYFSEGLVATIH